jgi:hypothetical protein
MRAVVVGAHLRREDVEPVAAAIDLGGIVLSGVEVAEDQPLGDRDLLLRVAKVRAELLDRATFIAVRYGFAVRGESEAREKCAAQLARWREVLERNAGNVEMTLKVAAAAPLPRPDRHDFASGAGYLRALHASAQAADADPRFREAVDARLGSLALASRWQHRDNASIECALLVPREAVPRLTAAGEELKREFPAVPFLLSGPWPLEVFADADQ